ncbi:hypothetical protein TNCV_1744521 [Trichonephila clavipes]|nr:hypothetical protein TNCV_1744521 [Trichonephila clavipes]
MSIGSWNAERAFVHMPEDAIANTQKDLTDLIPAISKKIKRVSEIRNQTLVPHPKMPLVPTFSAPASSVPEGLFKKAPVTVCVIDTRPELSGKFVTISHIRYQIKIAHLQIRQGTSFCTPRRLRCGQGTMAPWARRLGCVLALDKCVQMWTRNYGALGQTTRVCFGVLCANKKKEEVKRDFGDLQIRRSEWRVVNTPLVFKKRTGEKEKEQRGKGQESPGERTDGRRRRDGKERGRRKETERDGKRVGERERVMPALNGKKG